MASTFTLTSKSHDGRYMKLTCTQKSNGSTKNSSTITWKLETLGGNAELYSTGATKVIINGTTVYSKARVSWSSETFPASLGSVTGTLTISHDNEGKLKIPVKFSTAIYTSTVTEYSGEWELDSIPRYATVTQSVVSKTETSITMKWTSDSTIDFIQYSKNDGSAWYTLDVADGTSGTYTFTGLTPNTTYNIKTMVRRKDSQLTTTSSKLAVTTYDYPYCTETPNFKVGETLKIPLANPLKREVTVKLIGNDDYVLATDITSGTSIEGYVTDKFIDNCYYSLPNNSKGNYKVEVTYGDTVKTTDKGAIYELDSTLNTPVFTTIGYYDYNAEVVAVTGNQNILVQGKSTLWGFVRVADKMVAQKGATPVKYVANFEGVRYEVPYSDTNDVILAMGTPTTIGSKRLIVDAYDSRGFYTRAYLDIPVISYTKPTVNIDVSRLNDFEEQTTLKITGTYDKLTVDGTDKNSVTSIEYRYKETEGTWSDWATVNTTLSNGKYTCTDVVLTLDSSKSFDIEVKATDKLDYNTASGSVDVGVAIFFISTSDKACYINDQKIVNSVDSKLGKNLFNKNDSIVMGRYFNETGSLAESDVAWYQATFIKVDSNTEYTVSAESYPLRVALYNSEKAFIERLVTTTENSLTFTTSSECEYLRISANSGYEESLQLEQGSVATEYEDYVTPTIYGRDHTGEFKPLDFLTRNDLVNLIYPVGAIYMSMSPTSPALLFGGYWEQLQDKFLVGAGGTYAVNDTGGNTTHTHSFSHTHGVPGVAHTHGANNTHNGTMYAAMSPSGTNGLRYLTQTGISYTPNERKADGGAGYTYSTKQTEGIQVMGKTASATPSATTTNSQSTTTTGSGSSLPPYVAVYMWKRIG